MNRCYHGKKRGLFRKISGKKYKKTGHLPHGTQSAHFSKNREILPGMTRECFRFLFSRYIHF
ncbi:MAG: hypothetical protein CVV30_00415 [Methanomicrobiales archaeon HGW-Methanomicrobiales-1]|nr:MAG: hypothetical protein CVV30_00415 [Methanomicrobiales archaeon HGW-Methanomicrobiales-1]